MAAQRPLPSWFGNVGMGYSFALDRFGGPPSAALRGLVINDKLAKGLSPDVEAYVSAFKDYSRGQMAAALSKLLARHRSPGGFRLTSTKEIVYVCVAHLIGFEDAESLGREKDAVNGLVSGLDEATIKALPPVGMLCAQASTGFREPGPRSREIPRICYEQMPNNRYVAELYAERCQAGSVSLSHPPPTPANILDRPGFDYRNSLKVHLLIERRWPKFARNHWMLALLYFGLKRNREGDAELHQYVNIPFDPSEGLPDLRDQARKMLSSP
jgi:hypothetical protein